MYFTQQKVFLASIFFIICIIYNNPFFSIFLQLLKKTAKSPVDQVGQKKRQVTRLDASLDLSASRASKAHCTDGVMGAPAISKASVDRDFHAVLPASEAIMINISFIQRSLFRSTQFVTISKNPSHKGLAQGGKITLQ